MAKPGTPARDNLCHIAAERYNGSKGIGATSVAPKEVYVNQPLPIIGVLAGDAAGIGPELITSLWASGFLAQYSRPVVIGDWRVMRRAAAVTGTEEALARLPLCQDLDCVRQQLAQGAGAVFFDQGDTDPDEVPFGKVNEIAGRACLRMMDLGVEMCRDGVLEGLVFAPFNKTSLMMGGSDAASELVYLARACGVESGYCEMNVMDGIWTTRVTSHIPLAEVSRRITPDAVYEAIVLADQTLRRTGLEPRIGVAALNPHAGESGNCGREEIEQLTPAIERARAAGMDASGPWPADTIFVRAYAGQFDAVVTMYHDQGQIALKMRGFERGAAVDGGLPYPIATCTHGTAFDIAGQGKAWTTALESAVRIVSDMAVRARD